MQNQNRDPVTTPTSQLSSLSSQLAAAATCPPFPSAGSKTGSTAATPTSAATPTTPTTTTTAATSSSSNNDNNSSSSGSRNSSSNPTVAASSSAKDATASSAAMPDNLFGAPLTPRRMSIPNRPALQVAPILDPALGYSVARRPRLDFARSCMPLPIHPSVVPPSWLANVRYRHFAAPLDACHRVVARLVAAGLSPRWRLSHPAGRQLLPPARLAHRLQQLPPWVVARRLVAGLRVDAGLCLGRRQRLVLRRRPRPRL